MAYATKNKDFSINWKLRKERLYTHWTRENPVNQAQFAFRNHWRVFYRLLKNSNFNGGKRCLEVGCGRGTMSSYFTEAGYDSTLLDLSESIISVARKIFQNNKLKAKFLVADTRFLPIKDSSFDIVFSFGLLEHFRDVELPISEQIRVLKKKGLFLGYVVPEYKNNIQKQYLWINQLLKGYAKAPGVFRYKQKLYRSGYNSKNYMAIMRKFGLIDINSSGIYPVPMISHSVEFPFTLMPPKSEKALVKYLEKILKSRRKLRADPWLCKEGYGQAFLLWGLKNK